MIKNRLIMYRKYFNYSNPPNLPTNMFQNHILTTTNENDTILFDLGTAVVKYMNSIIQCKFQIDRIHQRLEMYTMMVMLTDWFVK